MNEKIDKNYKTILSYYIDENTIYELKYNPKTKKTYFIIYRDNKKENIPENNDNRYELKYDPKLKMHYFIINFDDKRGNENE